MLRNIQPNMYLVVYAMSAQNWQSLHQPFCLCPFLVCGEWLVRCVRESVSCLIGCHVQRCNVWLCTSGVSHVSHGSSIDFICPLIFYWFRNCNEINRWYVLCLVYFSLFIVNPFYECVTWHYVMATCMWSVQWFIWVLW